MTREEHRAALVKGIHPDVLAATDDELIDAGWADFERAKIPANWRDAKPKRRKGGRKKIHVTPDAQREAQRAAWQKYDQKHPYRKRELRARIKSRLDEIAPAVQESRARRQVQAAESTELRRNARNNPPS